MFIAIFVCLKFNNIFYLLLLLSILLLSRNNKINPDPNDKSNKCKFLYHNIRGLYNNIKYLQITCHKYDVILCSVIWYLIVNMFQKYPYLNLISQQYFLEIPDLLFVGQQPMLGRGFLLQSGKKYYCTWRCFLQIKTFIM